MKRILLFIMLLACASVAGCSGLVAKSDTAALIDRDAALMQARTSTTQPAPALAANAERFKAYHETATVNFFAYLFGGKSIYCTAQIYDDLQTKAVLSDAFSKAATQPGIEPARNSGRLAFESIWMTNIKREKDGK